MPTPKLTSRGATSDRKFATPNAASHADRLNPALSTVVDDLVGAVAANATLTGTARTCVGGQRVMVEGWATQPGTIYIDTSTDGGSTWPNTDSEYIVAGDHVQATFTLEGGANRYRLRFVCGAVGANKVHFSSTTRA